MADTWVEYTLEWEVRTARQDERATGVKWRLMRNASTVLTAEDLPWMRQQRDDINRGDGKSIRNARIVRKVCEVHQ